MFQPHMLVYCSVYSCCYAMIARRSMLCLVMAGKHINSTWAIIRQLLCKWVPMATDMPSMVDVLLNYNVFFYVVRTELL
jgi:hypothetical protein